MRTRHSLAGTLVVAAAGLLIAGSAGADDGKAPVKRLLSKEFQNSSTLKDTDRSSTDGEIFTTVAAGPNGTGGVVIYDKRLVGIPDDIDVLDIEFEGQGDVHNGSALLMNAKVNGVLCQPLRGQTAGGGGGPHLQTGWYTLLNLPQPPLSTSNRCISPTGAVGDGGGGTADCHDNTVVFSCCARIETDDARVQISLANLPGGPVASPNISFIERTMVVIEGTKDNKNHTLCTGVSTAAHTEVLRKDD